MSDDERDDQDGDEVTDPSSPEAGDEPMSAPLSGRTRTILLIVGVLAVGFLLGSFLVGGDDDSGDDDALAGVGGADSEIPFPSGDVNRTGYWGWCNLGATTIDTFDRPGAPDDLGTTGTGQDWEVIAGTWGIQDDSARTTGSDDDEVPPLAVVPEGTGDGLTEVTLTRMEEGAGLAFRHLDAENYWSVTANPSVGSWSVTRVIDGDPELVGELQGPTNNGVTVSVTQNGSNLQFLVEGEEYLTLTDAALADQLQGGLIAAPTTAGDARWDRFLVMTFEDEEGETNPCAPAE